MDDEDKAPSFTTLTYEDRRILGLEDKIELSWTGHKVGYSPSEDGRFIRSNLDPVTMTNDINVVSIHPAGLLVMKWIYKEGDNLDEKRNSEAWIEGLPGGDIENIIFTHYYIGPSQVTSLEMGRNRQMNYATCPIGFYLEERARSSVSEEEGEDIPF